MSIYSDMQTDLKELVQLIRLDEQFTAIVAQGILPLDQQSNLAHRYWLSRINELSRKYGLSEHE